jgi:XTP/dITP diphosphohydrolase
MPTFVLATANPHKTAEMSAVLAELGIEVLPRPQGLPDVDETAETLAGNALLKAHAIMQASGQAAVADDTGLFVDALGGAPGVYSARYSGEGATDKKNVEKLLTALAESSDGERTATFRTVIALVYPDGREIVVEGVLPGVIIDAPRGEHGFGYDPVFLPDVANGRTLAEMTLEEKNEQSHRARALRALAEALL